MGSGYTTQQDRAAGPDAGDRPLTLEQADDALFERLFAVVQAVRAACRSAIATHGPWSPAHADLVDIEDMLLELIDDADFVQIAPSATPEHGGAR